MVALGVAVVKQNLEQGGVGGIYLVAELVTSTNPDRCTTCMVVSVSDVCPL